MLSNLWDENMFVMDPMSIKWCLHIFVLTGTVGSDESSTGYIATACYARVEIFHEQD